MTRRIASIRLRAGAVLAVAAALFAALALSAAAATSRGGRAPATQPSAQIGISGTGAVVLNGQLTAIGTIPGKGTMSVHDLQGDARVALNGARPKGGRIINVRRASGALYVKGSRVRVRITGAGLSLSVAGRGKVTLTGVGTYQLNGEEAQPWPEDLGQIDLRPPATSGTRTGTGR